MTQPVHPGSQQSLPSREFVKQLFAETETDTNLVYCFPKQLIDCFKSIEGDAAPPLLDNDSIVRELQLTDHVTSFDQVAFRYNSVNQTSSVVNYRYLGEAPKPISPEYLKLAGSKNPEAAAKEFNAVFEPHHLHVQAYCGWLLQQEAYWRDLKFVIGLLGEELVDSLLPQQAFSAPCDSEFIESVHEPTQAFRMFCEKWRLQGMGTLDLPVVVEPQYTPVSLYTPKSYPGCVAPFLPDIFPFDAGKPISKALDHARLGIEAPHLDEWKELIAVASRKKKEVAHYARQFCLQHYWRVLVQRYPEQTHRRKSEVEEAFGRYFDVSLTTIRRDSQKIAILLDQNLSCLL